MIFEEVIDIKLDKVLVEKYHLGIFASGYERRCTIFLANNKNLFFEDKLVFGFEEYKNDIFRKNNDLYFLNNGFDSITSIDNNDESKIFSALGKVLKEKSELNEIRILIDYSSMSRFWYLSIINWIRFNEFTKVIIDFVYTVGEYKNEVNQLLIEEIISLPGLEGSSNFNNQSIAFFGLGFDGYATLCLYDKIEPDISYAFVASPPFYPKYKNRALEINKELIENNINFPYIELPLKSVEQSFRILSELINNYRNTGDISIIPMGPKPHVLTSILLGIRYKDVACLYAKGQRKLSENVSGVDEYVITRVIFSS